HERAGVENRLARRPERGVQTVPDREREAVAAGAGAEVVAPFPRDAAKAAGAGHVHDRRLNLGEESLRINLRPVARIERAAVEAGAVGGPPAVAAEAVHAPGLPRADRDTSRARAHSVAR